MKPLTAGLLWLCLVPLLPASAVAQQNELGPAVQLEQLRGKRASAAASADLPQAATWFDTSDRALVASAYAGDFAPLATTPMGFTGNVAAGQAGTTSAMYQAAALARASWFRRMAGLAGELSLDAELSRRGQLGALMLGANGALSHNPPSSWLHYSADGADALGHSNVCTWSGFGDPGCIASYMQDYGSSNTAVGHRRWILSPKVLTIGTGDVIDSVGRNWNALWVIPNDYWTRPRPATRDEFVAWPPRGYVPYQVVWPRWSFSLPDADFSAATVSMVRNGAVVPVRLESLANGYADNTLVWVPDNQNANSFVSALSAPATDTPVQVTISNVRVNGTPRTYAYTVIIFNPASSAPGLNVSPTSAQLPAAGGTGTLTVTNGSGWSASSNAAWLLVSANTALGTVIYSAAANPGVAPRSAIITVGTQQVTITQLAASATYSLQPASASVGASAGSGSFIVNVTPAAASWSVTGTSGSITVTSALSGTGDGVITYTWPANTSTQSRIATVTISAAVFTLTQAGTGSTPPPAGEALRFVPVTPCRIADTRNPAGPFGGPFVDAGATRSFILPNSGCGIPANARTYSLNVTVVPRGILGYLTLWPTGQAQPFVSTLNSLDGRIKANAAIVPAGTAGAVSVYVTHAADVILDVNGYFVPASDATALAFYALTPCRVVDTRESGRGLLGAPHLNANQARTFPLLSSACGIPASARAYSLNFTVVPRGSLGFLSTWPTGRAQPVVSTLNALTGAITANAAVVPAGNGGAIDVFATHETDAIIDINGYFAPAGTGGLALYNVTPCRVLDTRQSGPRLNGTRDINFTSSGCALPVAARAYAVNATVVPAAPLGYLSLYPQGQAQPLVSTLNAIDAALTSNLAIVPTSNGSISAFTSSSTDLFVDISAYFAP